MSYLFGESATEPEVDELVRDEGGEHAELLKQLLNSPGLAQLIEQNTEYRDKPTPLHLIHCSMLRREL